MAEPKTAQDFFPGNPAADFHMRRAVEVYKEFGERQKALKPITDYYGYRRETVHHIYELGDIQIVEHSDQGAEVHGFSVWIGLQNQHEYATTLDQAILTALCAKYNSTPATYRVARMIGMVKPKE